MTIDDPQGADPTALATISIMVRLRRTVTEEVHVSVPITEDLIVDEPDGSSHLAGGAVFAAAVRIGQTTTLAWRPEGDPVVEIHPLQTPPNPAAD